VLKPLIWFLAILCYTLSADAQTKVVANQVVSHSNVTNPNNAIVDDNNFATLQSYGGIALGIGSYSGELELQFPGMIPANTTTYVRIDFDNDVLNALLGGSLGTLLADVLGTVVFGNHYFNIQAKNNNTVVLSNSSLTPPNDSRFRIVQDALGNFYIAITPDQNYNRIYIEDRTSALLLGTFNSMNVYSAFYYSDHNCTFDPLYTDYDGAGITLDLLNLGGAGVTNPENAINDDPNNFSEISLGVVGVLASMQQNIYFPATYSPSTNFEVTLKTDPTLVTLGLLNNVQVTRGALLNEINF